MTAIAYFGAGCFWGVELRFSRLLGVVATAVGYAAGHTQNPTYKQVCNGNTGHAEIVRVEFDPAIISYAALLHEFFAMHDPTTPNQQGPDIGTQYRSIIMLDGDDQRIAAQQAIASAQTRFQKPIVTEIIPLAPFYLAEDYHQKYLEKRGSTIGCH